MCCWELPTSPFLVASKRERQLSTQDETWPAMNKGNTAAGIYEVFQTFVHIWRKGGVSVATYEGLGVTTELSTSKQTSPHIVKQHSWAGDVSAIQTFFFQKVPHKRRIRRTSDQVMVSMHLLKIGWGRDDWGSRRISCVTFGKKTAKLLLVQLTARTYIEDYPVCTGLSRLDR